MTRDDIIRKPLTEEQKLDLVTNWFSEDWAIKNALGLLDDYDTVRADGIGEQAMNEKPKALRLAELLNEATTVLDEPFHHNAIAENCDKAAAELRRLHEENERLRGAITELLESARAPGGGNRGHILRPATREHEARVEKAWLDLEAALRREGTT